jgi:hypothetical protein
VSVIQARIWWHDAHRTCSLQSLGDGSVYKVNNPAHIMTWVCLTFFHLCWEHGNTISFVRSVPPCMDVEPRFVNSGKCKT